MTRKDYEIIARAIKSALADYQQDHQNGDLAGLVGGAVKNTAIHIAEELGQDNPRFDYHTFMKACGFYR